MLRNMKCPSDMKLLRKEVKFAIMCEAHFIREAYFILRSRTSLARRANFIEKSLMQGIRLFSGGGGRIRLHFHSLWE